MSQPLRSLIYVGDPMCSWCWGFAPVVEDLADDYPVEVVVGGLRPGPAAQTVDDGMASYLRDTWQTIGEKTGQPFDTAFLDKAEGWLYDTAPAAVAVVQMRSTDPDSTLSYFTTIQHAFYALGRDVTDLDVLAEIAGSFDVDAEAFRKAIGDEEATKAAWADFSRSRNWGIGGFPALIGDLEGDRLALLARGFTETDLIRSRIESLDE